MIKELWVPMQQILGSVMPFHTLLLSLSITQMPGMYVVYIFRLVFTCVCLIVMSTSTFSSNGLPPSGITFTFLVILLLEHTSTNNPYLRLVRFCGSSSRASAPVPSVVSFTFQHERHSEDSRQSETRKTLLDGVYCYV